MINVLTNHIVAVLPVADDIVCVSCYNPVVVSRYNQHLPGVNHRTCKHTSQVGNNDVYFKSLHDIKHPKSSVQSTYTLWLLQLTIFSDVILNRERADGKLGYLSQRTKRMCQVTLAPALMHTHRNTRTCGRA